MEVELEIPSSPAGSFSLKEHTHLILISKVCAPLEGSLAAASDLVRLLMVLEEGVEWEMTCVCAKHPCLVRGRANLTKANAGFTPFQIEHSQI